MKAVIRSQPRLTAALRSGGGVAQVEVSPFFVATLIDFADLSHYYYGGVYRDGTWRINRFSKTGLIKTTASQSENSGIANLASAWPVRSSLVYGA